MAVGGNDIEQWVAEERVHLVYRQLPTANWGNIAAGLATWAAVATSGLPWFAYVPLALLVALNFARFLLVRWYRREREQVPTSRWRQRAVTSATAIGVCWGLVGFLTFPLAPLELQTFIIVVELGIVAGAVGTVGHLRTGFVGFIGPQVAGLTVATAAFHRPHGVVLAGLLVIFLAIMLRVGREYEQTVSRSLTLSFEKQALVAELTAERDRAESARARAEAASRAKSDFLARMSHEIRTPMNGVLGATELLLSGELEPGPRQLVETVGQSGRALLTLIDDLLDVAKIEAGKVRLEVVPFALEPLLEEVLASVALVARRKRLFLGYQLDAPPWVHGDPLRLRQVLLNLLGNAVKFTSEGEVVLTCRAREGEQLRFEVRDTGIGLTDEQRGRVFESFEQADTSTTRRYGGTGLGLSIARQLVALMGGELGVDSAPGQGSTFSFEARLPTAAAPVTAPVVEGRGRTVRLDVARPLERENLTRWLEAAGFVVDAGPTPELVIAEHLDVPPGEAPPAARRPHALVVIERDAVVHPPADGRAWLNAPLRRSATLEAVARSLGQRSPASRSVLGDARWVDARVLLADDDPINRRVVSGMLTRLGCTPLVVEGGPQALAALREAPFELAFLDLEMPELDGEGVTRDLRALERESGRARTPIIALTAHATETHRARCLAAGMDEMITKPVSMQTLSECLLRRLDRQ